MGTVRADRMVTDYVGCTFQWCNRVLDARLDQNGNALITGDFRGQIDFGGGPRESLDEGDGFLAKLGP